MDPYGMTYGDFLRSNPASTLEVFFLIITTFLLLLVFGVCYWGFGNIQLRKKEKLFVSIFKSLVIIFILLSIRLQLMHLFSAAQGDTFQTDQIAWALYSLIINLGGLTYELTWLTILFILARVTFFWKNRKETE